MDGIYTWVNTIEVSSNPFEDTLKQSRWFPAFPWKHIISGATFSGSTWEVTITDLYSGIKVGGKHATISPSSYLQVFEVPLSNISDQLNQKLFDVQLSLDFS